MNIPAVPKPITITFFDKVITQVQDILKAELSWLNYSFGQSQRLVTRRHHKEFFYPGIHIYRRIYISVMPDQNLGNFSFFTLEDPHNVDYNPYTTNKVSVKYGLVFWFNLKSIFPSSNDRNIESVKEQILKVLVNKMFLSYGQISVNSIQQEAQNIYKGYSLKEIDNQFLMYPYAGLRFEGVISLREDC